MSNDEKTAENTAAKVTTKAIPEAKPTDNKPSVDPLATQLRNELSLVVDIKHLNASNILDAISKGMQIAKNIKTTTNEQKKILLLNVLASMIKDSDLASSAKDDLVWVVDEMGPASIELFLIVSGKGVSAFRAANPKCSSCFSKCFPC